MSRLAGRARCAAPLAALTLAALSVAVPSAAASSSALPFHDANARGTLTFCNRANQPMTSGSLDTVPFAWKTISSAAAPTRYRGSDARATLAAYQPLQFVDPGDWSGSQLTGSSSFTSSAHPVAQATNGDPPLLNFVQAYPPHWRGLVEVRMLFSGVDLPQHISPYPAAVLSVKGNTWTLLSGGGGSCSEGSGVSDESVLLPKKKIDKQEKVVPAGETSSASPSASTPGSGSTQSAAPGSSSGHASDSASATGATSGGLASGAKAAIGLAVIAVIAVIGSLTLWWRRRSARSNS